MAYSINVLDVFKRINQGLWRWLGQWVLVLQSWGPQFDLSFSLTPSWLRQLLLVFHRVGFGVSAAMSNDKPPFWDPVFLSVSTCWPLLNSLYAFSCVEHRPGKAFVLTLESARPWLLWLWAPSGSHGASWCPGLPPGYWAVSLYFYPLDLRWFMKPLPMIQADSRFQTLPSYGGTFSQDLVLEHWTLEQVSCYARPPGPSSALTTLHLNSISILLRSLSSNKNDPILFFFMVSVHDILGRICLSNLKLHTLWQ